MKRELNFNACASDIDLYINAYIGATQEIPSDPRYVKSPQVKAMHVKLTLQLFTFSAKMLFP
jgi:hypothetical protein